MEIQIHVMMKKKKKKKKMMLERAILVQGRQ
jgi:hypothetical protein